MTEQERIEAIEAFTKLIYGHERIKGSLPWTKLSRDDIECLAHSVATMMRSVYNAGLLKGRWLYENVIHGDWDNASDDARKVCIEASITMHEIIEAEHAQESFDQA